MKIQRIVSLRDFAITALKSTSETIPRQKKGMYKTNGKDTLAIMEIVEQQAEMIKELSEELLKSKE